MDLNGIDRGRGFENTQSGQAGFRRLSAGVVDAEVTIEEWHGEGVRVGEGIE